MPLPAADPCAPYLARWTLTPEGPALRTPSSDLLPVRWHSRAAMLKVARSPEEEVGHRLMVWLGGQGAAQVYAHAGPALLMERLSSVGPTLAEQVYSGHDAAATRLLAGAAARLHQPRTQPAPPLTPLREWFRALEAAAPQGELLARAWATAQALLDDPHDIRPLHGDLHHGNLLRRNDTEWALIDPKGLVGERGYDYANILCNPDPDWARRPGRRAAQADLIAGVAGLPRERLLRWTLAYTGLSAAWWLEGGESAQAQATLDLTRIVAALLP